MWRASKETAGKLKTNSLKETVFSREYSRVWGNRYRLYNVRPMNFYTSR